MKAGVKMTNAQMETAINKARTFHLYIEEAEVLKVKSGVYKIYIIERRENNLDILIPDNVEVIQYVKSGLIEKLLKANNNASNTLIGHVRVYGGRSLISGFNNLFSLLQAEIIELGLDNPIKAEVEGDTDTNMGLKDIVAKEFIVHNLAIPRQYADYCFNQYGNSVKTIKYKAEKLIIENLTFDTRVLHYCFGGVQVNNLEIYNLNIPDVSWIHGLFKNCKVENLKIRKFNINYNIITGISIDKMFSESKIKNLDISDIGLKHVKHITEAFESSKIDNIHIDGIDTSETENMSKLFARAIIGGELDLRWMNTQHLMIASEMFNYCDAKEVIGLDAFCTSNISKADSMFCWASIKNLDLGNWDMPKINSTKQMFMGIRPQKFVLPNMMYNSIIRAEEMFKQCRVDVLDLTRMSVSCDATMNRIFESCRASIIKMPNVHINKSANAYCAFLDCDSALECNDESLKKVSEVRTPYV